jgi:hypothetical protein
MKRKLKLLSLVSLLLATAMFFGCVNDDRSQEILQKYSDCEHVNPEDNKIGFNIVNISKEQDSSFFVQWKCDVAINSLLVAAFMTFIDADDPDNFKIGLASRFKDNIGEHDKMSVTMDKQAKFVIIYFQGIDESIENSEPYLTSPLFFIAELGDNPKLLDEKPRYAGDLFNSFNEK